MSDRSNQSVFLFDDAAPASSASMLQYDLLKQSILLRAEVHQNAASIRLTLFASHQQLQIMCGVSFRKLDKLRSIRTRKGCRNHFKLCPSQLSEARLGQLRLLHLPTD